MFPLSAGKHDSGPRDLYSKDGVLTVDFSYQTTPGPDGKPMYCFVNADGMQSPTLHVKPGDTLVLKLTNLVPKETGEKLAMPAMEMSKAGAGGCGAANMTSSSVNVHYHGTNVPPVCHQDEVIHTIINSGETFHYEVHFPKDEPSGLYWYHPHIHGISTAAVQGGATGALIVDGIENVNPEVAGLPQRVIVLRDNQPVNPPPGPTDNDAAADLSVNYIPVGGPLYIPAEFSMKSGETQFWRILNSAAVSILDLQLNYDGVPQPLEIVALNGVPIGSQEGSGKGRTLTRSHLLIPPAGRAESIVTGPPAGVQRANFITRKVDTGPVGDPDPMRPLFRIRTTTADPATSSVTSIPATSGTPPPERFMGLAEANRSEENHEFHIHQIHFLLLARNGVKVPADQQQVIDTVDLPYWSATGPYPSITLRMDFRENAVGDFVYHCHILDHEDGGMRAIIE